MFLIIVVFDKLTLEKERLTKLEAKKLFWIFFKHDFKKNKIAYEPKQIVPKMIN